MPTTGTSTSGRSPAADCADLGAYPAGWQAYLRIAATPGVMIDIDQWMAPAPAEDEGDDRRDRGEDALKALGSS